MLGVDESRLPRLSAEPSDGWYPALADAACSNLGAGCVGTARAALNVGTSGALRILYETERPQPRPGLFLYRLDERRVVEGGALSDGGNLHAWLEATLSDAGGSLLERGPDEHGLTFLPFLGGERSTGWDPDAPGAIARAHLRDDPARHPPGRRSRASRFRFAAIADLLPEVEEVVATGGGLLADPEWTQIDGRRARPAGHRVGWSRRRRCGARRSRRSSGSGTRPPRRRSARCSSRGRSGPRHIVQRGNGNSGFTRSFVTNC